ncbi:YfiR family protein [bacterium]|nr:YfiR family protein [bacterium]
MMKTVAAILMVAVLLIGSGYAQQDEQAVAAYKAALLIKLVEYVSWPEGQGPADGEPIVISVVGDSKVYDELAKIANFSALEPKPKVQHLAEDDEYTGTHVMFITTDDEATLATILGKAASESILTIGDAEGFGEAGVMVNFIRDVDAKKKEKFEVNLTKVKDASLKISSKFLKLAHIIEEG